MHSSAFPPCINWMWYHLKFCWNRKTHGLVSMECLWRCHTCTLHTGTDANTSWCRTTSSCHREIHCIDVWPWKFWWQCEHGQADYLHTERQGYRECTTNTGCSLPASPCGISSWPCVGPGLAEYPTTTQSSRFCLLEAEKQYRQLGSGMDEPATCWGNVLCCSQMWLC